MDAFNAAIKELLEKALLHDFENYDVIGFDVDHCLAQYNVPNLLMMTYRAIISTMVKERSYPETMLELGTASADFVAKGLVADKKTGCLLKLGDGNQILRAYYGFVQLTPREV